MRRFICRIRPEKAVSPINIGPKRLYFRKRVVSLKEPRSRIREDGTEQGIREWQSHCCTVLFTIRELIYTWDVSFGTQQAQNSVYSRIKREQMQRGDATAASRKTFTRQSLYFFAFLTRRASSLRSMLTSRSRSLFFYCCSIIETSL